MEDDKLFATGFNEYFTNIGSVLDSKIPKAKSDPISFMKGNYTINLFLNLTDPAEVTSIINKLKDGAPGWDNIPAKIYKKSIDIIATPLVHAINLSLQNGIFPDELKLANILPLYKAGNDFELNNY